MVEPITLLSSAALTVTAFVGSLGYRLAGRLIPSHFEDAQWANIEVQRERLAFEQQRAVEQIDEVRRNILLQIESTQKLHELNERLRGWPLRCRAIHILDVSQNCRPAALNVILTLSQYGRDTKATEGSGWAQAADRLRTAAAAADRHLRDLFTKDLVFYDETENPTALRSRSLEAALYGLLRTEPTVLIEVEMTRPLLYKFYIREWGNAFSSDEPPTAVQTISVDLRPHQADPLVCQHLLSGTLLFLTAFMTDAFHVLRRAHEIPAPVLRLPRLMQDFSELPQQIWSPVTSAYVSMYDQIGARLPFVAAEAAAEAAIGAHSAKNLAFAKSLLEKGVALYRAARLPETTGGDFDGVLARALLADEQLQGRPLRLRTALETILGAESDFHVIAQKLGSAEVSGRDAASLDFERKMNSFRR